MSSTPRSALFFDNANSPDADDSYYESFELRDMRRRDQDHAIFSFIDRTRKISIGRGRDCDYRVGVEPGSAVSRHHALITLLEPGRYQLHDISKNGTTILHEDGTYEILNRGNVGTLRNGDILYLVNVWSNKDERPPLSTERGAILRFIHLKK